MSEAGPGSRLRLGTQRIILEFPGQGLAGSVGRRDLGSGRMHEMPFITVTWWVFFSLQNWKKLAKRTIRLTGESSSLSMGLRAWRRFASRRVFQKHETSLSPDAAQQLAFCLLVRDLAGSNGVATVTPVRGTTFQAQHGRS